MASVRERNGRFTGLYHDAEGRQRSAGAYSTRTEAKAAERGTGPVKAEVAYAPNVRGKTTVASYAYEWFRSHPMSLHTQYVYGAILRVHILPALGGRAIADITTADIRTYFRSLEAQEMSAALGKKIKTVLSSMFQKAAEDSVFGSTSSVASASRRPRRSAGGRSRQVSGTGSGST